MVIETVGDSIGDGPAVADLQRGILGSQSQIIHEARSIP